jgi:hypothetical protein
MIEISFVIRISSLIFYRRLVSTGRIVPLMFIIGGMLFALSLGA